jgi:two-component system, OmpR family, KDP operon response regulator KdpE
MSTNSPLILLVDDEPPIRRLVHTSLTAEGYRVLEAEDGQQAVRLAAQQPPDLVILDLGLPDIDGQAILRQLREWLTAPIIILSARDQEKQKIAALDGGADDYLTKPFGAGELLARIRVALRHADRVAGDRAESLLTVGELSIDFATRRVAVGEAEIHLTPIEYKLLTTLARTAGKVLTHQALLNNVWGPNRTQEVHYLRVFMASLRRKIEADSARPRYLLTEQGVGYRLAGE